MEEGLTLLVVVWTNVIYCFCYDGNCWLLEAWKRFWWEYCYVFWCMVVMVDTAGFCSMSTFCWFLFPWESVEYCVGSVCWTWLKTFCVIGGEDVGLILAVWILAMLIPVCWGTNLYGWFRWRVCGGMVMEGDWLEIWAALGVVVLGIGGLVIVGGCWDDEGTYLFGLTMGMGNYPLLNCWLLLLLDEVNEKL
jgi:hypothetical protein